MTPAAIAVAKRTQPMLKTVRMKIRVNSEVYAKMSQLAESRSGATYSRMVRSALTRWLAEAEAEEFVCQNYDSRRVLKPAGAPFPPRINSIRTGSPPQAEEIDAVQVSLRLPEPLRERIYNALFWRDEYLSHVAREALDTETDRLLSL